VNVATGRHDVERFRVAIARSLGLQFDDSRLGLLDEVLQRRLAGLRICADAYLSDLETGRAAAEPATLARELTVGETYFFRNGEQFRALAEIVLPQRMAARAGARTLRILSAGCASGEEPYSVAILLREAILDPSWEVEVRAVDLNPAALEKAARGRYSSWALRETPAEAQRKWFRRDGRELVLDAGIRAAVRFAESNLAGDDAALWQPQSLDVVFCRNVIMYFVADRARALLARIERALRPGGYLFLGHAETLRGLSDDFHLRHTHETFYYQRKESAEGAAARPGYPVAPSRAAFDAVSNIDASWVEVIQAASDRVAALASDVRQASQASPGLMPRWDLAGVFDLLRTEHFAEALALVGELPAAATGDPDVLLLTATLLAHSGQSDAAETTCRRLFLIDDLNAGAHYVFALCREAAGDPAGAIEHNRVAAYLDPAFAMPRLHLGLLARRGGEPDAARRELAQALILLQREDPSRLLLFGGGFRRDALLALCRSALRACGGEP
jgi:chemotaxis protein methyltransferase CheR